MLAPSITTTIDELVRHIDRFGVEASRDALSTLARLATAHGVMPASVEVLADESAPAILRERAAATVAGALLAVAPAAALAA